MKNILLLSALALSLYGSAGAQPNSTNAASVPAPRPRPVLHVRSFTPEQNQEVNKAHNAALFANPGLAAEEKRLLKIFQDAHDNDESPGPDVIVQMKDFNKKLCAAMVKIDPKVEPLLAKLPFIITLLVASGQGEQSPPPAP
jgi:hypothetical protein